jgi:hypothetical protein
LNPAGTLILSTGISPGAFGAGGCAIGASVESASDDGWPCFLDDWPEGEHEGHGDHEQRQGVAQHDGPPFGSRTVGN